MSEFIKINRDITSHWLWQDAERLKWWLDLLLMAATEDHKVIHDSHVFTLKRGQVIASSVTLKKRWKKSRPTIIEYLKNLETDGLITRSILYRHTPIITICCNSGKVDTLNNSVNDCKSSKTTCKENGEVDTIVDTIVDTLNSGKVDTLNLKNTTSCKSDDYKKPQKTSSPSKPPRARVISYAINNNINYKPPFFQKEGMSDRTSDAPVSPFSCKKFVEFWNSEIEAHKSVMPKVKAIGEGSKRRVQLTARVKEYGKEAVAEMVRKAAQSDFLNGKNRNGWIATLDWLIKPSNFPKVLEGNYDNKQHTKPPSASTTDYEARIMEQKQREEQQRKQKEAAVTPEQYARWKREHAEEFERQQRQLAQGCKLTDDSS